MNNDRESCPDPGRTVFISHHGFRTGRWLLAVPAHLAMVGSVLAAAFAVASSALVAESSPLPPAVAAGTTAPTSSPSPSRTEGSVVPASPEPAEDSSSSSEAWAALDGLEVAARGSMSDYDRHARFGDWIDADGDCVGTRDEILARDLTDVESDDGCQVTSGMLDDPYTGTPISFTRGGVPPPRTCRSIMSSPPATPGSPDLAASPRPSGWRSTTTR